MHFTFYLKNSINVCDCDLDSYEEIWNKMTELAHQYNGGYFSITHENGCHTLYRIISVEDERVQCTLM